MPTPGGRKYHQHPLPTAPVTNALCKIWPHDVLVGSPRPRNDSVASARMEPAITSTALAITSASTPGRMCRHRIAGDDNPTVRARATTSRSRNASACERTIRAVLGQLVMAMTNTIMGRLCPMIAPSAIINGKLGSTRKKSVMRIRTASMKPVNQPARTPTSVPISTVMIVAINPI